MKLFNIFKKHNECTKTVVENGMELFKGEVIDLDEEELELCKEFPTL